jgi:hypothetical protein
MFGFFFITTISEIGLCEQFPLKLQLMLKEQPNNKILEENESKIKYFKPASVENLESLFDAAIT